MCGQFVEIKGDTILDHLVDVEQLLNFRNIVKKQRIKRPYQCFRYFLPYRSDKIPALSYMRYFIYGNFIQQLF